MEEYDKFGEPQEVTKVTERDKYWDTMCEGIGFGLNKEYGVEPKVGDMIAFSPEAILGCEVSGVKINDELVFHKSKRELEEEHKQRVADQTKTKKEKFEEDKESLDKQYDNLPDVFQKRLDKFRTNNPDFRWEFEPYEMFCCEQALLISGKLTEADKVKEFSKLDYDEQKKMIPELSDEHSGNTFGMSCKLAYIYLKDPDSVIKLHGALASLVGSEAYGCVSKEEIEEDASEEESL
jgi:hypothetical protein